MEINEARKIVKSKLSTNRYDHTIRVYNVAVKLAEIFKAPMKEVELAAIFHDYCKNNSEQSLKESIIIYDLPESLLQFNKELWHGPVAAKMIDEKYGLNNPSIVNAIYYHTTARANMDLVEKIIYVADYIEPNRSFPLVDEVRQLAVKNIDEAVFHTIRNTIIYLMNKKEKIHPDSFQAYNYFIKF